MAHPIDNGQIPLVNKPATIIGVTVTFLGIVCIAVSLRLYVRLRDRLWGWDDMFVVLATLTATTGSILTCLMPRTGMGRHYWTLGHEQVMEYFKHIWLTNATYAASTTLIKLAILFQYLRLFDMQIRFARLLTWALIALISCWGISFFFLALFSCIPIQKNWHFALPGRCVAWGSKNPNSFFASWAAHSASNMVLDITVLLLPIPFLKGLRMGEKTRAGLIALFTMGGIVAMLSIARLIALCIKRAGTVPYFDPSFATPAIFLLSVLEINIAILCASIPIFWPLVISLAANKILVVNEIEIRTDRRASQNIALAEQGRSGTIIGLSDTDNKDGDDDDDEDDDDDDPVKPNTRRPASWSHYDHPYAISSASSMTKSLSIDTSRELGHRISQDSQRSLAHQPSIQFTNPDLQPPTSNTPMHYQDRYVASWVCPDFDTVGPPGHGANGFEAKVESAEMPYHHLRALEQ